MSKYWSAITENIRPYVPGEQPKDRKYIKLNTNENPYPPSPEVIKAIKQAANETLRLYPDPAGDDLRATLARYYEVKKEQVFVGNGSDEILAFSFPAFFTPGKPVLYPDITYSFYPVYCNLFHIDYELVPLDEEFTVPADAFYKKNGGIVLANPNAPTGKCMPLHSIRSILERNPDSVVIIDEAYIDFGGESAVAMIKEYPNLLVIQTLSKSRSLAGLRVGFALGHEDLIEGLRRIKDSMNSYTLDRLALAGAQEAIKDESYFRQTTKKIIALREKTSEELRRLGFKVIPSCANFIFISHQRCPAGELFQQLRGKGVLVRYFNLPRIDNYLRVTIGSDEEMSSFLKAVKESIAET